MADAIQQLAGKLFQGKSNIVFTGAGISTESGISDYRSKGGVWDRYRPVMFDEFMSSRAARERYWAQKMDMYTELGVARPNAAHLALAAMYEKGQIRAVITQNIDGLHQEAGLPESAVIELHGNTRRIRCMGCGEISSLSAALDAIRHGDSAPECACGSYLKPDTISFGQALREADLDRAARLSAGSDVFLVIGSTLVVTPASLMPQYALDNGAFLAIINLSETPYDKKCHLLIREKAGTALTALLDKLAQFKD